MTAIRSCKKISIDKFEEIVHMMQGGVIHQCPPRPHSPKRHPPLSGTSMRLLPLPPPADKPPPPSSPVTEKQQCVLVFIHQPVDEAVCLLCSACKPKMSRPELPQKLGWVGVCVCVLRGGGFVHSWVGVCVLRVGGGESIVNISL